MHTLYIILLALTFSSFRFQHRNNYVDDFVGKNTANIIKGIFIWLVFISHLSQYLKPIHPELFGTDINLIQSFLGQMIVVPFLFYSGYGLLYNVKNGGGYCASIPKKRVFTVLLNFDIAVILYIVMDLFLSQDLTIKQILLSFIAWESVGNSNWYIFTIIILYLITYFSSMKYGYSKKCIITLSILVVLYSILMSSFKASWWYDTTFAFAFGAIYCYKKTQIDSFMKAHFMSLILALLLCFILLYFAPNIRGFFVNIRSIILSLSILLLTMRVALRNKFLEWSGKNLFPLYIYQRLPMIVFSTVTFGSINFIVDKPYLYILGVTGLTILIAYLHKYIAIKL